MAAKDFSLDLFDLLLALLGHGVLLVDKCQVFEQGLQVLAVLALNSIAWKTFISTTSFEGHGSTRLAQILVLALRLEASVFWKSEIIPHLQKLLVVCRGFCILFFDLSQDCLLL